MENVTGGPHPFGFIDILKGLPVVPKIIMYVGLALFFIGVFSGPFALFHNPKMSSGVGLMFSSLSWRKFEDSIGHHPSPPYQIYLDFGNAFWGLGFGAVGAWM